MLNVIYAHFTPSVNNNPSVHNVFKLWSQEVELKDRDTRLRILSDEQDKVIRMQQMQQKKIRKDIEGVRKQLTHERSLKLDAFTGVDDLQTQVIYVYFENIIST